MSCLLAAALALVSAAGGPSPEEAAVDDLTEVQGRWQVIGMYKDGRAVPEVRWKDLHWVFADDKVTHHHGPAPCTQCRFRLERTADPPELVIAYGGGAQQRQLFRIRGDVLEVAESDSSADPPRGFTPDLGCDVLFVLRRVRP